MTETATASRSMHITVVGTGHVGLVTAAALAKVGHDVVGVDADAAKIDLLQAGKSPIYEPGLDELLDDVTASGRLRFSTQVEEGVDQAEVAFICVGTPARPDGRTNMRAVEHAATAIGRAAQADLVVAHKSTVPVQTAERVRTILDRWGRERFCVVSNPEFLREGQAVQDALEPERIVVGSDDARGHEMMRAVYAPWMNGRTRYFETDIRTAELAKHACNAFLALKISYVNALARICDAAGADVTAVAEIMGSDPRIGRAFLNAGLGYGGYCFPKDIAAFRAQARRLGYEFRLLDEVVAINEEAVRSTLETVEDILWNLEGKRIALFGLAFKPGTDDVRESPALKLARMLSDAGALVVGYDPQAAENARAEMPDLEVALDPYEAATGADCVILCTEWPEFSELDLSRIKSLMSEPNLLDARNAIDPRSATDAGLAYVGTGRRAEGV